MKQTKLAELIANQYSYWLMDVTLHGSQLRAPLQRVDYLSIGEKARQLTVVEMPSTGDQNINSWENMASHQEKDSIDCLPSRAENSVLL